MQKYTFYSFQGFCWIFLGYSLRLWRPGRLQASNSKVSQCGVSKSTCSSYCTVPSIKCLLGIVLFSALFILTKEVNLPYFLEFFAAYIQILPFTLARNGFCLQ